MDILRFNASYCSSKSIRMRYDLVWYRNDISHVAIFFDLLQSIILFISTQSSSTEFKCLGWFSVCLRNYKHIGLDEGMNANPNNKLYTCSKHIDQEMFIVYTDPLPYTSISVLLPNQEVDKHLLGIQMQERCISLITMLQDHELLIIHVYMDFMSPLVFFFV